MISFKIKNTENVVKESNKQILKKCHKGTLTVEAALILPLFIYFIIVFLYFIQIFIVQEHIQASITRMGMDLSKAAYIYQDFASEDEVKNFDFSIFDSEFEIKPGDMTDKLAGIALLKFYARQFLDNRVIKSCIAGGFDGISFYGSDLLDSENDIDIIVSYKIKLPVKLFIIDEMLLMQRVRMRKWTGLGLQAPNSIHNDDDESIVYVTETGTVYHTKKTCSHISLSVRAVSGIPVDLRNESGARYYPCELCCKEPTDDGVYYITSDGTRYHAVRNCSRIKRTVKEIKLSEVGNRTLCKRCAKS